MKVGELIGNSDFYFDLCYKLKVFDWEALEYKDIWVHEGEEDFSDYYYNGAISKYCNVSDFYDLKITGITGDRGYIVITCE